MKSFFTIFTIFVLTPLFGFKLLTETVNIKGHLRKNPKDTSSYIINVFIFVKVDDRILSKTITDSNGDFEMTFSSEKVKSFDFYCTGLNIDTLLVASVKTFESDTPEITFYIPGNHKKNFFGKTICPKCNRPDKVYKIKYGDTPVMTRQISKSGDTTYSPIYKGTYQESCIVRPAKYYCYRDKVKF